MANFSVVIPCYKQAQFLGQAIESVLNQTLPNIEVIVVNDGSPDNTDQVAREFGNKIIYLAKKNGGVASARNYGLKHAHGKMVLFLDSDDWIAPDMLEKHYTAALSHPERDVFYGDCTLTDVNGNPLGLQIMQPPPEDVFHWLLRQNRFPPCTITWRRDALDRHGIFLTERHYYGHEDWELLLRMAARKCKFLHIPGAFAYYRRHPASISLNPFSMWNSGHAILKIALQHHPECNECKEIYPGRHNFLDRSCVELLRQQFRLHIQKGEIAPILKLIPPTLSKGYTIWSPLASDAWATFKRRIK